MVIETKLEKKKAMTVNAHLKTLAAQQLASSPVDKSMHLPAVFLKFPIFVVKRAHLTSL